MAKVVFLNVPAYGHVNPTLALVRELILQGDEVIYYTSPEFKDTLERIGASFRPYCRELGVDHATAAENSFGLMYEMAHYATQITDALLEEIADIRPDYIIHDALCVWGRIVSEKCNIPAICSVPYMVFTPLNILVSFKLMLLLQVMFWQGFGKIIAFWHAIRQLKQSYGVSLYRLIWEIGSYEPLNIVYTSTLFQPLGNYLHGKFQFIGPSIAARGDSPALPFELLSNKKIIYISLGTVNSVRQNDFYRLCFEALSQLTDLQIILSVGKHTQISDLGEIPSNFLVRHYVPQLELLAHTQLFITHAGMNSVQESLYFNVPMIAIPQTFEQMMNAVRMENLGVGVMVNKNRLTPQKLRQLVLKSLEPNPKREAMLAQLQESFRQAGGYPKAIELINTYEEAYLSPYYNPIL